MPSALRMPTVDENEYDDRMREVASKTKLGPDGLILNHYATFMNNPEFLERWMRLAGTAVKRNSLSERHKLMVIMKVAAELKCTYAWNTRQSEKDQAKFIASLHGRPQDYMTHEQMMAISRPVSEGDWTPTEAALLQAVEETRTQGGISTPTWTVLAKEYDKRQMFDLTMLIGFYLLTESMINSLGVECYTGLKNSPENAPWANVDNGSR